MRRLAKQMLKNEDGAVSVLFALSMAFLLGFAALSVDVAMVHLKKAEMQNAADAGALAGAQDLPDAGNAVSKAKDFAELNGAEKSNTTATTPYGGDATKIEVVCTKNVQYSFARVLGFTDADVSARAVAQKTSSPGGYAIFSGDDDTELILNGPDIDVVGDVHTNDTFKANGERITVDGVVEAVDDVELDGDDQDIPNVEEDAENIPLADYAESIGLDPDLVDSELASATTYSGDKEITSDPGHVVYAKGKLLIKTNSLHITHSIIAKEDIEIDAENLVLDCPVIYSKRGKIMVKKGNITINGTLYTKKEWIEINNSGDPVTINGSIVGKYVRLNGPHITVDASSVSGSEGRRIKLIE